MHLAWRASRVLKRKGDISACQAKCACGSQQACIARVFCVELLRCAIQEYARQEKSGPYKIGCNKLIHSNRICQTG